MNKLNSKCSFKKHGKKGMHSSKIHDRVWEEDNK